LRAFFVDAIAVQSANSHKGSWMKSETLLVVHEH